MNLQRIGNLIIMKVKIIFLITTDHGLLQFGPLYEKLLQDEVFEPQFILVPNMQQELQGSFSINLIDKAREKFGYKNIDFIFSVDDLKRIKPAYVFYQTTFSIQHPTCLPKDVSTFAKVCFMPYGFYLTDYTFNKLSKEFLANAHTIFFESPKSLEVMDLILDAETAKIAKSKTVISGLPKLEELKKYTMEFEKNPRKFDYLWKGKNTKRIIWAPHWSLFWNGSPTGFCTLLNNLDYICEIFRHNKNLECVLRMHPFLEDALVRNKIFEEESLRQFLNFIDSQPNMRVDRSDNYFDLFVSSTAMITDGVSFLAEYSLTKKPLLNTINENGPELNPLGEAIRSNLYTAVNNIEIKDFIERVILNEDDFMQESRIKNIDDLIGVNSNGMVSRIVTHIKEDFKNSFKESINIQATV
jgi:hypothetical protein